VTPQLLGLPEKVLQVGLMFLPSNVFLPWQTPSFLGRIMVFEPTPPQHEAFSPHVYETVDYT
jgi:hypothetical protein